MKKTFRPQLSPRFAALAGDGQRWRRHGGYDEIAGPRLCRRIFQLRATAETEIAESTIGTLLAVGDSVWERIV